MIPKKAYTQPTTCRAVMRMSPPMPLDYPRPTLGEAQSALNVPASSEKYEKKQRGQGGDAPISAFRMQQISVMRSDDAGRLLLRGRNPCKSPKSTSKTTGDIRTSPHSYRTILLHFEWVSILTKAFIRYPNAQLRRSLVNLVEAIARRPEIKMWHLTRNGQTVSTVRSTAAPAPDEKST